MTPALLWLTCFCRPPHLVCMGMPWAGTIEPRPEKSLEFPKISLWRPWSRLGSIGGRALRQLPAGRVSRSTRSRLTGAGTNRFGFDAAPPRLKRREAKTGLASGWCRPLPFTERRTRRRISEIQLVFAEGHCLVEEHLDGRTFAETGIGPSAEQNAEHTCSRYGSDAYARSALSIACGSTNTGTNHSA